MSKKSKRDKDKTWSQRQFSFRIWLRDYTLHISATVTILCILMIIFGALGLFVYDQHNDWLPPTIKDWVAFIHGAKNEKDQHFDLCLLPLGVLLILFSGWYMGSNIYDRRKFDKLMETESKSEFMDNLDDIEKLAWDLSTDHEYRVMEKKEELGVTKKKR